MHAAYMSLKGANVVANCTVPCCTNGNSDYNDHYNEGFDDDDAGGSVDDGQDDDGYDDHHNYYSYSCNYNSNCCCYCCATSLELHRL